MFGIQKNVNVKFNLVLNRKTGQSFLFFLGAAVFWVLGASFFCIILHASFHNFEALQDGDGGEPLLTGNITEDV